MLGFDAVFTLNLFQLIGFFSATATAYVFFRLLRVGLPTSAIFAMAFALLPAHFKQILAGHPFLAAYWPLPIVGILILMVAGPETNPFEAWVGAARTRRRAAARRWATILPIALVCGSAQSYFYVFAAIMAGAVWALAAIRTIADRSLWSALRWQTVTLASFVVVVGIQLSVLSLDLGDRYAKYFRARIPLESDLYAGKLVSLLVPWSDTGLPFVGRLSRAVFVNSRVVGQSETPWTPFIVSIGLVLLLVVALARVLPGRRTHSRIETSLSAPTTRVLSAALVVAVLFYVAGGGGVIFATVISPEIRAWARLSTVICLLMLAILARTLSDLLAGRGLVIALIVVSVVIAMDQVAGATSRMDVKPRTDAEIRALDRALEARYATGCGIVQLPLKEFPESGDIRRMGDYDHGLPDLYTSRFRWSYGGVKGTRSADYWNTARTPNVIAERIRASKACAVFVDLDAYGRDARAWRSVVDQVSDASNPALTSSDGRYLVFDVSAGRGPRFGRSGDQ